MKALGSVGDLLSEGRHQRERGELFAKAHFPDCPVHLEESVAVHRALERLLRQQCAKLDPDGTVSDLLRDRPAWRAMDSLELVEFQMAVEEELGRGHPPISYPTREEAFGTGVLRALLGPAAASTTWSGETIWMRSIRGIINERVRHRGACSCV